MATQGRSANVYQRVRQLIVTGRIAPGTRVVETTVAERLGVSRTPVRAALQRLAQEGYVAIEDGRRSRSLVAPLTRADARELFFIVGEIEGLAARWAAELPDGERGDVAKDLDGFNGDYRSASRETDPDFDRLFRLDERFHRRYVEAGAGPRLRALHDAIKPQAERYIRVYIGALTEAIQISLTEHDAIVAAIEDGHPDAAQQAVQTNWRNAAGRLSRVIESVGERGQW